MISVVVVHDKVYDLRIQGKMYMIQSFKCLERHLLMLSFRTHVFAPSVMQIHMLTDYCILLSRQGMEHGAHLT